MNFITCYPDANSFKDIIRVKSLEDWHVEYVPLTDTVGYWVGDDPFYDNGFELYRDLVAMFPIVSSNNDKYCWDANPFATIHLPSWASEAIAVLIKEFYLKNISPYGNNSQINEWGNLYRNDARPLKSYQIPHIDYQAGFIGNLWFSSHEPGTTGTNIYEYTGKYIDSAYDFQVDPTHPLHKKYKANLYRLDKWENFSDKDAENWGFKKLGFAPCIEGKVTMYKANQPHCPWLDDSVKFRWSHSYAFHYDPIRMSNLIK